MRVAKRMMLVPVDSFSRCCIGRSECMFERQRACGVATFAETGWWRCPELLGLWPLTLVPGQARKLALEECI